MVEAFLNATVEQGWSTEETSVNYKLKVTCNLVPRSHSVTGNVSTFPVTE